MFCEKCGTPINEGEAFCPNCGAPVAAAKPAETAPVNPALNPTTVMVWGIVALALCEVPIAGIILAIIARKKVKAYLAAGGQTCTQSKLGSIFSKIALPISIVMLVLWIVGVSCSACAAAIAAANGVTDEVFGLLAF